MYIEGIGEVKLIDKNECRLLNRAKSLLDGMEKGEDVKVRERIDLVIRGEIGITYGQMMIEARGVFGREDIKDLVDLTFGECVWFGKWLVSNKMRLRKKYPSTFVMKVARTREDDILHERAKQKQWYEGKFTKRRGKGIELRKKTTGKC